jgi:hypothetical protein
MFLSCLKLQSEQQRMPGIARGTISHPRASCAIRQASSGRAGEWPKSGEWLGLLDALDAGSETP